MSDAIAGEFRFAPSQDEILLGILEKRRWHRRYWTAVATVLPGAGALGLLLFDLTRSRAMSAIPAIGWLSVIVYSQLRSNLLPCPRCGESFPSIGVQSPWTPRCRSCDLSLDPPPR